MNCLYIRFLGDNSEEGLRLVSWFYSKKKRGVIVFKSLTDDDPGEVAELIAARYLVVEKNIFKYESPVYTGVGHPINFFMNSYKYVSDDLPYDKGWVYKKFFRIYFSGVPIVRDSFSPDLTPTLEEARVVGKVECILPDNFSDLGVVESDSIGRFTVTEEAFNSYESLHKYFHGWEVRNYRRTLIYSLKNSLVSKIYGSFPARVIGP